MIDIKICAIFDFIAALKYTFEVIETDCFTLIRQPTCLPPGLRHARDVKYGSSRLRSTTGLAFPERPVLSQVEGSRGDAQYLSATVLPLSLCLFVSLSLLLY
jgi:hypothetical protein